MTRAFPRPGRLVELAYRDLLTAQYGTEEQRRALGPTEALSRPWDPPTCAPAVRQQVWAWLEEVAAWVNHEYAWATDRLIPPCWPAHPHLGHELAVLADLRRSAGRHLSGEGLEDWHRYSLPMFLDRLHDRLHDCCVGGHQDWPAAARHKAYHGSDQERSRRQWFSDDLRPPPSHTAAGWPHPARLALVDLDTAEVHQPRPPNGGR